MRVCMLTDKPLPQDRPTGIGVAGYGLALALSRRGVTLDYVCRGAGGENRINDHLTVQTLDHFSRDNAGMVRRLVSRTGCRIVHVHSSAAFPSVLLAKLLNRKVVIHSHDTEALRPLRNGLSRQAAVELSDLVVSVSEETRRKVIRTHRISRRKTEVVYNGVDPAVFRVLGRDEGVAARYGISATEDLLLSIGAVQRRKGQWRIIESLPEILKDRPGLVYINVGAVYDPDYRNALIERARALGVGQAVRFLTGVPEDDLVSIVNLAKICVHPSTREGFGLAVVEEMACGKPVVGFDTSALPELVENGVDGVLVPLEDTRGLTSSILNILSDTPLAEKLGDAARRKVLARFTWDMAAAKLEGVYDGLLSNL